MLKQVFLEKLGKALSGLPQEDIEERLAFYSEMVDDRMEEGYLEEEAVDAIGPVEEIAAHIVADVPLTKIVKEKVTAGRRLNAWAIVLLLLGAPVWLSLLIAAAAVMFSLYVSVWAVIIALWAVAVSVAVSAAAGLPAAVFFAFQGNGVTALAMAAEGLVCAGLAILIFFGCRMITKGVLYCTKKAVLRIKSSFIGKENNQ